ncbi:uncharacterized protein VTP21DRAFT_5134 [Calcarisporiella thermophila]|uniref:uncharacterized protein n=1 Tax=Calcarisporiella thermophila TaxID=911321 RepID=UPI0037449E2D
MEPEFILYSSSMLRGEGGAKQRMKPGRKPNPASSCKRKERNRAAQKAFRDRKESRLRELEAENQRLLRNVHEHSTKLKYLREMVHDLKIESTFLQTIATFATDIMRIHNIPLTELDTLFVKHVHSSPILPSEYFNLCTQSRSYTEEKFKLFLERMAPRSPNSGQMARAGKSLDIINELQTSNTTTLFPTSTSTAPISTSNESTAEQMDQELAPDMESLLGVGKSPSAFPQDISVLDIPLEQLILHNSDLQVATPQSTLGLIWPEHSDGSSKIDGNIANEKYHFAPNVTAIENQYNSTPDPSSFPYFNDIISCKYSTPKLSIAGSNDLPACMYHSGGFIVPGTSIAAVDMIDFLWVRAQELKDKIFMPTLLQSQIKHLNFINIIPSYFWRDQLILYEDTYDPSELMSTILKYFVCTGDPLHTGSWQGSIEFFEKYPFLYDADCPYSQCKILDIYFKVGEREHIIAAIAGCGRDGLNSSTATYVACL